MTSKYRIIPVYEEGRYAVQVRFLWWWLYSEEFPILYKSVEEADKAVQQHVRNSLWAKASPPVDYDKYGKRIENSA